MQRCSVCPPPLAVDMCCDETVSSGSSTNTPLITSTRHITLCPITCIVPATPRPLTVGRRFPTSPRRQAERIALQNVGEEPEMVEGVKTVVEVWLVCVLAALLVCFGVSVYFMFFWKPKDE
eukprot:TRINITY_DN1277_c0_g1_i4.p3 TRINITY_DN1277_c0_g1~~TRINITY_DN1277_c0_g1_i4.p3  ORF type:complete len:121 (-),score=19.77 TRINITY_DN1277_c0_g1_i4:208-570(-)